MKVLCVFGTRPEAIKMCPIIIELRNRQKIDCVVCVTGQHKEMLYQVLETFSIIPEYDLEIMKEKQSLLDITVGILEKLDSILENEKPELVLVHGDTTSSLAAALATFYKKIPIGHVEAGLRTFDMNSPYPEEFNRQAVDLITTLYFAPTEYAKQQLLSEGKRKECVFVTGNTVIDALRTTVKEKYTNPNIEWAMGSKLILVTAHRRENIGEPMRNMFLAIKRIVEENKDVKVIYPVHRNPVVREIANDILGENKRIRLIEPLDVIDFHNYMNKSYLILTDSGGIQEEAPSLGKPVLVMRDTTERPEGVEAGILKLVGTDERTIYSEVCCLLNNEEEYLKMSNKTNPYGDGHAAEKICDIIEKSIGE